MCWSNRHLDKKNTDERHNARQKAVEIRFHMVPRSYLLVFLWSLGDGWTLATTKQETRSRTRTAISSILSSNEQHLALHRRVVICWQWRHIRDRMTLEPSGRRTYIYISLRRVWATDSVHSRYSLRQYSLPWHLSSIENFTKCFLWRTTNSLPVMKTFKWYHWSRSEAFSLSLTKVEYT